MSDDRSSAVPQAPHRHETLQAALDLIDQGFTLIDRDLKMVAWNKTFLRLLDFPDSLVYVGAPFESFMRFNAERGEYGPGDPEVLIRERVEAARSFEPHLFERTRLDGTVLQVRGVPVADLGFVTIYSDITAQRKADQEIQQHAAKLETRVAERTTELHRSEAQMRLITDSIPALVAYFDSNRNYRYINRGYKDWFGLDPARPERVSAREYLGTNTYAGIRHNVARALAGQSVSFEYEVTVRGGMQLLARTTLIPELEPDGRVAGCFELTFDITEQRRSQVMLVHAQKMEALGQLTGGLAHDFNNILTVVIGNLEALQRERHDDPAMAGFVAPAVGAARRGAELIKRLLSFARKQPLAARETDTGALVAEVARLVHRSLPESLQLSVRVAGAPVWAWTDPELLQNSLLNLILNARDATAAGGHITVGVEARKLDAEAAGTLQVVPGRYVGVSVADDGCGMDEATLVRACEPFFTTKGPAAGTGLGMAMVYGFVKQSGGGMHIESRPGAGTTVSLWLPACGAPEEAERLSIEASDVARASHGLALLVEDDPGVRQVVRRDLLALGYAVLEAENGGEALAILDRTPAISLVLTDMVMPGGIDGRAVAAHARERCRVPRVALMSGYAPGSRSKTDLPILAKPFSRTQLAAWLDELPMP